MMMIKGERRWRILEMVVGASLVMLRQVVDGDSACVHTYFEARDSRGGHCDDGTYVAGNNCGVYDNSQFKASQMCCDCGGGMNWIRAS